MWRAAAWQRKNTDLRLVSTTASQSGLGEVEAVAAADDAGIVDEDVEPAELVHGFIHDSVHRLDRREVGGE
jgi:hypothetical protein